jgi:predicted nucleic acid-binding Zn ribbon protein
MKRSHCVVCDKGVGEGIIVCSECAKTLGEPRRTRDEDAIMTFKIDKRKAEGRR